MITVFRQFSGKRYGIQGVFMDVIKYHSLAKVFTGISTYLKQTLIP